MIRRTKKMNFRSETVDKNKENARNVLPVILWPQLILNTGVRH